ncbi:hypothetical protein F4780DRAFT_746956 [Xylariomycetidae sp. FL0641]|nr:hypothetical protein F4780DRAFT_746956 [Xylariomycetidae sp. FL0641]
MDDYEWQWIADPGPSIESPWFRVQRRTSKREPSKSPGDLVQRFPIPPAESDLGGRWVLGIPMGQGGRYFMMALSMMRIVQFLGRTCAVERLSRECPPRWTRFWPAERLLSAESIRTRDVRPWVRSGSEGPFHRYRGVSARATSEKEAPSVSLLNLMRLGPRDLCTATTRKLRTRSAGRYGESPGGQGQERRDSLASTSYSSSVPT